MRDGDRRTPSTARRAQRLLAGLATVLLATTAAAQGAGELNIDNWSDYIAPSTVPGFEKETGIRVHYDVFDSNEALFAKMAVGDTGYDLVVPSSNWAAVDILGGLLSPLDKARIPNYANIDPELLRRLAAIDPGNRYLVPWMWGYATVGINTRLVRHALGDLALPDNPWDLVFDPVYASRLAGCGVSFLDSGSDLMEAALNYLGLPHDTQDPADFERAFALLERVRGNVMEFSSSGYINDLAGGAICTAIGWSGDLAIAAQRMREAGTGDAIQVFPPSHGAVIAIDAMAIPADAHNVGNAHRFINHRLRPEISAADTDAVFYANPVPASRPLVAAAIRDADHVFLAPDMLARLLPPRRYTLEQRRMVNRLFTRYKIRL